MFKDRLRQTREEKDISQTEMAKKIGIAVTTYRNYENTSREPTYDILLNIAKSLDVSIDYLLENDSKKSKLDTIVIRAENLPEESLKELINYIDYLRYKERKKS